MNALSTIALTLFGIFSLVELGATKFNMTKVRYLSSPILMPLLILFYVAYVRDENWLIIAALGFGFLGDIFMLWQEKEILVMMGMGSFMACLVCYAVALLQPFALLGGVPGWFYLLLIPYALYILVHYRILRSYLGDMLLPSVIYFVVVLAASFTALLRIWSYRGHSFWLPLFGSLFFVLSDTILGYHLFKYDGKSKHGEFFAGLTYIPAQLLLVLGFSL